MTAFGRFRTAFGSFRTASGRLLAIVDGFSLSWTAFSYRERRFADRPYPFFFSFFQSVQCFHCSIFHVFIFPKCTIFPISMFSVSQIFKVFTICSKFFAPKNLAMDFFGCVGFLGYRVSTNSIPNKR